MVTWPVLVLRAHRCSNTDAALQWDGRSVAVERAKHSAFYHLDTDLVAWIIPKNVLSLVFQRWG